VNDYRFVERHPSTTGSRYRLQLVGIDGSRSWRGIAVA
jgi:hypothetical protein